MADGDWDAENFEPPTFVKGTTDKWEGEDEEDVKDTWEELGDENEEKEKEEGKKDDEEGDGVRAFQRKKKKKMVNIIAEKEAKEKAEEEEEKKEEKNPKTPEDVFQEKLRKQRLQEEADLAVTRETFGLKSEEPEPWAMSLESKEDFDAFQKSLVSQLEKHTKSPLLVPFLEELMREISIGLTAEDVKKLGGTLNAIHAEKLKAAKSKAKKKGKAKVSLKVGKDQDEYGYVGGELDNEYDDFI